MRFASRLQVRAQCLRDCYFVRSAAFLDLRRLVALRSRAMLIRLLMRSEQRFTRGQIDKRLRHARDSR